MSNRKPALACQFLYRLNQFLQLLKNEQPTGNGIIDDVYGVDFANDDGDPFDDQMHGTHCAGTIAGHPNEEGEHHRA